MSMNEEVTRICQGCGRTFTIPYAELDRMWQLGLSHPVFCSNECCMHGWDPYAVHMGNLRRANAGDAAS